MSTRNSLVYNSKCHIYYDFHDDCLYIHRFSEDAKLLLNEDEWEELKKAIISKNHYETYLPPKIDV